MDPETWATIYQVKHTMTVPRSQSASIRAIPWGNAPHNRLIPAWEKQHCVTARTDIYCGYGSPSLNAVLLTKEPSMDL